MINHYVAVTIFALGSGLLRPRLFTLGLNNAEVTSTPLTNLTLGNTDKSLTALANFKKEVAYLELKMNDINEYFVITDITVHIKQVAQSYPQ